MNQELKTLSTINPMLLKGNFYQENTKAVLLHMNKEYDQYHIIIENSSLANKDKYFILNREEFLCFRETGFKNKLNDELSNIDVLSNKHIYDPRGEIIDKEEFNVSLVDHEGKFLVRFESNCYNDDTKIKEYFSNEEFENNFKNFLKKNADAVKKIFESHFIKLDRDLSYEKIRDVFVNYVADGKHTIRKFEEQLAHEYIAENRLKPSILSRLSYKEKLIKDHYPISDLQLGNIMKVEEDLILENGKELKKGDFYQIVKKYNDLTYFELINIDQENDFNGKKAIIFENKKGRLNHALRNITEIEKEKLKRSELFERFEIGAEIEFVFDKKRNTPEGKEVLIQKGSKGIVIESDYKVRLMIKEKGTDNVMYKDFYRSEIMSIGRETKKNYDWYALPITTSIEVQGRWFEDIPNSLSNVYYKGESVGILNDNGRLSLNEKYRNQFDENMKNTFETLPNEYKKRIDELHRMDKEIIMVNHLLNVNNMNKNSFKNIVDNYLKTMLNNEENYDYDKNDRKVVFH